MKKTEFISSRIISAPDCRRKMQQWRLHNKKVAFTNGIFDILHAGHIRSLCCAAAEADYLVVGLNSDASTKRLKGESRPVNTQESRALLLASLLMVDAVVIFDEDTPLELIKLLIPDVLLKGGDYSLDQIAGAREVMENGGRVIINPLLEGFSTTGLISKIKK